MTTPIESTWPQVEGLSLLWLAAQKVEKDDAIYEALYGPRDRSPSPDPVAVAASSQELSSGVRSPTPPLPEILRATKPYTPAPSVREQTVTYADWEQRQLPEWGLRADGGRSCPC